MTGATETTRRRLARRLRETAATPSELAREFDLTAATVLSHLEHVARSLDAGDEAVLVAPPTCRECGFDDFDDLLNVPSRCPSCKHEGIDEPTVTIE
ncbi:transcriptional regulator [Halovivax limisalsi]|uniref:transcriptional regulator n=1 Tax=Halovivax limisalsi TaxID=1453760 RepID=UPI001FFDC582|nr:transcriptional regulator [Halovivax limisalsi]